jgi:predicted DNA-binding protein (MmcQ/YjbR family)
MAPSPKQLCAALLAHALSLPEAWEDHPWGENVAKVGKKVFVFFGVPDPRDEQLIVCVKLPRSGVAALDLGFTEPAGYGLGKSGWIMARIGKGEPAPLPLLKGWIEESYRAIAPKKLIAQLDGAPAKRKPARKK